MPTIKDVAKYAKVSVSTVSYALSGKRPISSEVRERIERAIQDLGFTRSVLAHNLRKGISHTIGLVHPPREIMLEGSSIDFVFSASERIEPAYTLSLYPHPQSPAALLDAFKQRSIDGLILMHVARHDARVEALRATNYPFALIGRPENTEGLDLVDFDFEEAAFMAVEHLAMLGHTHIGYLDLPEKERQDDLGYAFYMQQGLLRAQQAFNIHLFCQTSGRSSTDSYKATCELLHQHDTITGMIVLLGATYLGVSRALFDLKRNIPADISVICLGSASVAEWVMPTVSTIDNQLTDLGRIAAELLLQRIAGTPRPKQVVLPAKLIRRESTACPGVKGRKT